MSSVDIRPNRHNVPILSRHWAASDPWASLLIVHGLGEHSGRYERTGSLLADAGIDTRAFDLCGHGGSGGDRIYIRSWTDYLHDVADQMAAVFGTGLPTVLLGHSMGGLIVATYVLSVHRQPDVVVLSAPALGEAGAAWQRALMPVLAKLAPKLMVPTAIKGEQLSRDPAVGEAYFADPLVEVKISAALGARLLEQVARVQERLDGYDARTLVIHGGMDELVPAAASMAVGARPGVDRKVYAHLRHETFNEPEGPEVVADVIGWLRAQLVSAE